MATDNGGAPPGLDPFNQSTPLNTREEIERRLGGAQPPRIDNAAFGQPTDPLKGQTQSKLKVIYRDIPNITGLGGWTPPTVRGALAAHAVGMFESSGRLVDDIIADDRVIATLRSRLTGLFGREVRFRAANNSSAAKECLIAWQETWEHLSGRGALQQIGGYQILFGWWPAQIIWDMSKPIKRPCLYPWHARFTYYHWDLRKYIALTQDAQQVIYPGDGKWMLHAPMGEYRAWMWGAIRSVATLWLLRWYALRDMSRFSEVHGMPIRKAIVPASSDPNERDLYAKQLEALGQETTIMVTQGADQAGMNFDLELVEAKDTAWEIFPGLRDYCDMGITLAMLMQNLTTEVKGGAFAATSAHMDIRQSGIEADNVGWRATLEQVARPFAYLNFGDPDLAPITDWDVTPPEDYESNARRFYSFGQAVQILRQGGVQFSDASELKRFARRTFGLKLPKTTEITDPDSGAGGKDDGESKPGDGKGKPEAPNQEG